jgi:predicted HTH domain antitoxin
MSLCRMTPMDVVVSMQTFLKERGVPLNYSAADLEADAATLEKGFKQINVGLYEH